MGGIANADAFAAGVRELEARYGCRLVSSVVSWQEGGATRFEPGPVRVLSTAPVVVDVPPIEEPPEIAAPPQLVTTADTVALWDMDVVQALQGDSPEAVERMKTDRTSPVFANDGAGATTRMVPAAGGHKAVEFVANHDVAQRAEGTAARWFIPDWSFFVKRSGKVLTVEYAALLPDAIRIKPGGSLGAGIQLKYGENGTGVLWALDLENAPGGAGVSPWVWSPTLGPIKPLRAWVHPVGTWVPVRVETLMRDADGWVEIYAEEQQLFQFRGRTLPHGIGLALYNIDAVPGDCRMLFGDVRFEVRPA